MMKKALIYTSLTLAAVLAFTGCAPDSSAPAQTAAQTSAAAKQTVSASAAQDAAASRLITPDEARALIGQPGVTLLDVRAKYEYDEAHIDGAVLLPYDAITAESPELPENKDDTIIVYCRSGRRSAIAADTLAVLGYTDIRDLGGIQDWPYETVTSAS